MNREGKKCVLYPRVSTEMQVDGYSLEGQKNSLKRFADREEMEIVGIYEDAGKSGKSIEGRPAFMLNFGKLYDIISDEEKKSLITYLIKEIQIYPNGESEMPLKSIEFNFPIYRDGQEVRRLLWEKGNTVETVCLLSRAK